jgi:hypothetical protein
VATIRTPDVLPLVIFSPILTPSKNVIKFLANRAGEIKSNVLLPTMLQPSDITLLVSALTGYNTRCVHSISRLLDTTPPLRLK